jgi:hypothetical protein
VLCLFLFVFPQGPHLAWLWLVGCFLCEGLRVMFVPGGVSPGSPPGLVVAGWLLSV